MLDLASEVVDLTQSKSTITFMPLPLDDPLIREPDIERAKDVLDWVPLVDRSDGLSATIADIRQRV
jgi:dTDP-glucose 4,6-dehydratase